MTDVVDLVRARFRARHFVESVARRQGLDLVAAQVLVDLELRQPSPDLQLVTPRALIAIVDDHVYYTSDLGKTDMHWLPVTSERHLEWLTKVEHSSRDLPNLAARVRLGLLLGWDRRVDKEEGGSEVAYLLNRYSGHTLGLYDPSSQVAFPPWDSSPETLALLIRWLHEHRILPSSKVVTTLHGSHGNVAPYWQVSFLDPKIVDARYQTVPLLTHTVHPHQAVCLALGELLNRLTLNIGSGHDPYYMCYDGHDQAAFKRQLDSLRQCDCSQSLGSQLRCCTRIDDDSLAQVALAQLSAVDGQEDDPEEG